MLIFSAITPHPPILIPSIGKDNLNQITKTKEAMETLGEELYALQPDTIIIISPHGLVQQDSFSVQMSDKYYGDFQNFGDLDTKFEFEPDISFINKIKIRAEKKNLPVQLIDESFMDHGALVPLYYLAKNMPKVKIVPIAFSFLSYQDHFEFGRYLKKTIIRSNKRIALIASGDLSHCLTDDAPAPYSPKGEIFDKKLIQIMEKKNYGDLLNFDKELIEEAKECGLRSFTVLSGALSEIECEPQLLSYESPFGVGYLVMNFKML
ncbi:AmmeMemoRadiSam system protein B [Candidatus Falkowbacteria bacterium]|jgi:MEMO1 family protein|nr:AmmeMemoRadiSam system protein B [Candidatus Falkowbacteria bacterium]MBT4433289.1 AmmeMemoRadiSam system protein B [Candidatus Falkowbacteria bacterium]